MSADNLFETINCEYCGKETSLYDTVPMYRITNTKRVFNGTYREYQKAEIKVPICEDCKEIVKRRDSLSSTITLISVAIFIVILIWQSIDRSWGYFILGVILSLFTLTFIISALSKWCVNILYPYDHPVDKNSSKTVKLLLSEGWNLGAKP